MARSYRVLITVDVYVDKEAESEWEDIEGELEDPFSWDLYHESLDFDISHTTVQVESYVEESY